MNDKTQTAIIIGAGPAGLTAAWELLKKTKIKPIVLESSEYIGGICRTLNVEGNRIDIGGHRFFSKSDRVVNWWLNIFPLGENPETTDKVMLKRSRLSRIRYLKKFFSYPISLSVDTLVNLGPIKVMRVGFSYLYTKFFPRKTETTLEDFMVNRFGWELYATFFKDYTEKLWGVPANQINSEWGAQRIKGVSISAVLLDALRSAIGIKNEKNVETSLIDAFMYPKYGPGQLWEEVARQVVEMGGEIRLRQKAVGINTLNNRASSVKVQNTDTSENYEVGGDVFFSTMPVKELISGMTGDVDPKIKQIAEGLQYRDFITVGVLFKKLRIPEVKDNWIYVQEPDVKILRFQIFNNWSPYMVKDKNTVWLGLEYTCNEGDELWSMSDEEFADFSIKELEKIGVASREDVLLKKTVRMPKAYPAYFGTYSQFDELKQFVNKFENLYLIGRNGMHRYNNTDHSMLTAIEAVNNIITGRKDKDNIWNVNAEKDYHETKAN